MELIKLAYFALVTFANGMIGFILNIDFLPVTLLILSILLIQYRTNMNIQRQMYGGRIRTRLRDLVSASLLAGILAGLGGSMLITVIGIGFTSLTGLMTVMVFSLLLMFFINPRYVCLAYSGGILGIVSLILNQFVSAGILDKQNSIVSFISNYLNFDVSSLMIIIAIMHLLESILMAVDGHRGAVPVFMKHNNKIVGGFVMQRIWILPVLFLILMKETQMGGQSIATPGWWPLFGPNMPRQMLRDSVFGAMPLIAMLGYTDFSITTPVKQKVRRTSTKLLIYSAVLLATALISYKVYVMKYIAALFACIGHEYLILLERYKESCGDPIWGYSEDGVVVVDTIPDSHAERIGIQSGDRLISINNKPVRSVDDILQILGEYMNFIWIDVVNFKGEKRLIEFHNFRENIRELGIITVPREDGTMMLVESGGNGSNLFLRLIDRFKK